MDDNEGSSRSCRPASASTELPQDSTGMLDLDEIVHPRSAAWTPGDKVAKFVAGRLRKPLEKEARGCLRAECPRPTLEHKVAHTPELDSKIATFWLSI